MEFKTLIFVAFISAASISAQSSTAVSPSRTKADVYLYALGQIESGGNDNAKGRAGEIGRYQCLKSVWREATAAPYHMAANKEVSDRVVLCIIWNRLGKDINEITPREFALGWHCPAKLHGKLNKERRDYVRRFENIVRKEMK